METKIPSYCRHKPTGQAYVAIGGKQIYLGKYGSEASHARYEKAISEWLAGVNNEDVATVVELCAAYFEHAESYYVKDGETTSELDSIRATIRKLRKLYGKLDVYEFKPRHVKALQQAWIQEGLTRVGINRRVSIVKRIFRWGVENEIVGPETFGAISAVSSLKKNRTTAKERSPVQPIDLETVEHTLTAACAEVADMVHLQLLSGARPGEICKLRPCDVNRTVDPWEYRVDSHKTEHHGKNRVVYFGPQAQAILTKYLLRPETELCFGYSTKSYARHVQRACHRLGIELWSPNRLRHTKATDIRARYGIDAARALLGHSNASTTEIYAELDADKARKIAKDIG